MPLNDMPPLQRCRRESDHMPAGALQWQWMGMGGKGRTRVTDTEAAAAIDKLTRFFERLELATRTMRSYCRQLGVEWNLFVHCCTNR